MGLRRDVHQLHAMTDDQHNSSTGDLVTHQMEEGQHYFANRNSYRQQEPAHTPKPRPAQKPQATKLGKLMVLLLGTR